MKVCNSPLVPTHLTPTSFLLLLSPSSPSLQRYAMKLEKLPAPIDLNFSGTAEEIEEQKQKAAAAAAARAVLKLEAIILSKLQKYPFV